MKSFGCLGLAVAGCLLALCSTADAGWPWEKEKPKAELSAWGWSKSCECTKGEPCTCGPNCTCATGVGCKGKAGSASTGDMSDVYMVGDAGQQCFTNAMGQRQCFVNGVQVPCAPQVQYVASTAPTAWGFQAAADPDVCPCCGMKMTAEQKAAMKAKAAVQAPVTYAAPMYFSNDAGSCATGSCGTGSASSAGGFRTPIRSFLFRGRGARGGCGG